jgi:hypothetical protein
LSIPDYDELEPEQEMRIFKAYFLIAETEKIISPNLLLGANYARNGSIPADTTEKSKAFSRKIKGLFVVI